MNYRSDVQLCAREIYNDLIGPQCVRQLSELRFLCARHSIPLLIDRTLPACYAGLWDGEEIILSAGLSLAQYREVIPHELVHSLADTPRWEWLNCQIQGWRYDREQFVESVAQLVGRMFAERVSPS